MLLEIPANRDYRKLFLAQIISLAGTGVSTIALALLAHSMAGEDAGKVLGIALAIKMVVYVFFTPLLSVVATLLPRKGLLMVLDFARAILLLGFFFVREVWQLYLLIFLLNLGSALFTPLFQSTIPDLLPSDEEYTRALSLSRVAYDVENIASPLLAGLLLSVMPFSSLFVLDGVSFLLSALLIVWSSLPEVKRNQASEGVLLYRLQFGIRSYWKTPRLRYALFLIWIVSFASAMVLVNTVVIVRESLGGSEEDVARAYLAAGAGSLLGAILIPFLTGRLGEKRTMMAGALLLLIGFLGGAAIKSYGVLLLIWWIFGAGWSLVQTPAGQLLKRSSRTEDRPAYFSAHFALTHLGWLVAYPLVGYGGVVPGLPSLFLLLAAGAFVVLATVFRLQGGDDEVYVREHTHQALEHVHWHEHDLHHRHHGSEKELARAHTHRHVHPAVRHSHYFVMDHHHRSWFS